jgi:predicted nucleotidyltransferase
MPLRKTLDRIKERLGALYGGRLRGIVLFGSEARGEARPDSDVDLLILLEGPVDRWRETKRINRTIYEVELATDPYRAINALPLDLDEYEAEAAPLYSTARQDGVLI